MEIKFGKLSNGFTTKFDKKIGFHFYFETMYNGIAQKKMTFF